MRASLTGSRRSSSAIRWPAAAGGGGLDGRDDRHRGHGDRPAGRLATVRPRSVPPTGERRPMRPRVLDLGGGEGDHGGGGVGLGEALVVVRRAFAVTLALFFAEGVIEGVVDGGRGRAGVVEGLAPPPVGEDEVGDGPDVVGGGLGPSVPAGMGGRGPGQDDVGAHALRPRGDADRARRFEQVVVDGGRAGGVQPPDELVLGLGPGVDEGGRVGVERLPAAHDLGPGGGVGRVADVDRQPETVEQLGPEVALLGVHRPHQQEPGRVAVGDAVPLHPVHPRRGRVEEGVDQVVGEQVDLVHVEDPAVGRRQQSWLEADLAPGEGRRQVERADHALLGRAEGQLDERTAVEQGGQPPGRASTWPTPCGPAATRRRSSGPPRPGPAPPWPPPPRPPPTTGTSASPPPNW